MRRVLATFIRRYPAPCLLILSIAFGSVPLFALKAGVLSPNGAQIGAMSASLAAFILVSIEKGAGGVIALFKRALIWRAPISVWAFVLLFPVLPSVLALYLYQWIGGPVVTWNGLEPIWNIIPLILTLMVLAGLGEEFGWRGFCLARLQQRNSPLMSSVIVGTMWGLWHFPLFLTDGTVQNSWVADSNIAVAFGGYTVFLIAWSVQYTWVFNKSDGSVLLAAFLHGAGNAWFGAYIDVYRGHFGGILVFTGIMMALSAILLIDRKAWRSTDRSC